jgi:hypothetical protein
MKQKDAVTGTSDFNTKTEYAMGRRVSVRTITNWIAAGLPHLKCGPRKVLVETAKADQWLRETFEVTRRPSGYKPRTNHAEVTQ